jgi:acyl carrier protein
MRAMGTGERDSESRSGKLERASTPRTKEQLLNVSELLSSVMRRPVSAIDSWTALTDIPGWDSIMMVRLMLSLEEKLGRELTEEEIADVATVANVERLMGPG